MSGVGSYGPIGPTAVDYRHTKMMDSNNMSSKEAEAARAKSAEVMAALRKGEKGDADRVLGDRPPAKDTVVGWIASRFKERKVSGSGSKGKEGEVVR